jgi:hypothetical protein
MGKRSKRRTRRSASCFALRDRTGSLDRPFAGRFWRGRPVGKFVVGGRAVAKVEHIDDERLRKRSVRFHVLSSFSTYTLPRGRKGRSWSVSQVPQAWFYSEECRKGAIYPHTIPYFLASLALTDISVAAYSSKCFLAGCVSVLSLAFSSSAVSVPTTSMSPTLRTV